MYRAVLSVLGIVEREKILELVHYFRGPINLRLLFLSGLGFPPRTAAPHKLPDNTGEKE